MAGIKTMLDANYWKKHKLEDGLGWGKTHPNDFWTAEEGGMTTRKWWPWTAANDLAAKNFMKDGLYLVRCTICKDERHQPSGVFICPKEECIQAVAVLLELGYEDGWGEVADDWYSTWYEEDADGYPRDVKPPQDLMESIHDSATQSVRDTLAEPKS